MDNVHRKKRKCKNTTFTSFKTYNPCYLNVLSENMRLNMENRKLKKKENEKINHGMDTLLQAIET
jgi:hypothetical protein